MSRNTQGYWAIGVGIVILIISLGADAMGFGNNLGLGWKQALGAVVGVIVAAVGAWLWQGFPPAPRSAPAGTARKIGGPARGGKPRAARRSRKSARRRR